MEACLHRASKPHPSCTLLASDNQLSLARSTLRTRRQRVFLALFSIIILALIVTHSTDLAGLLLIVEVAIKMEYGNDKGGEKEMQKLAIYSDNQLSLASSFS